MTGPALDELGPVDFIVVEFPPGHASFTGEMAEALLALVDAELADDPAVVSAVARTAGDFAAR